MQFHKSRSQKLPISKNDTCRPQKRVNDETHFDRRVCSNASVGLAALATTLAHPRLLFEPLHRQHTPYWTARQDNNVAVTVRSFRLRTHTAAVTPHAAMQQERAVHKGRGDLCVWAATRKLTWLAILPTEEKPSLGAVRCRRSVFSKVATNREGEHQSMHQMCFLVPRHHRKFAMAAGCEHSNLRGGNCRVRGHLRGCEHV